MTISASAGAAGMAGEPFHPAGGLAPRAPAAAPPPPSVAGLFGGGEGGARERAGDANLVHVDGELLRAGEGDDRGAAIDDRDRHRRLELAVLQPVLVAAGAADARGHSHAEAVGGFEPGPIGPHVLDAA